MNEWINAYYDEARVKSVSVLDKNNYYVQTEIDCIGIESKNGTSSVRITTYIICSLVCVGRRKKNWRHQQAEIKVYSIGYASWLQMIK